MLMDRSDAPWSGVTYHGFSDAPPVPPGRAPPPRPKPRRRPSGPVLLGGVAVAVGLGLAFGLLARPDLGVDSRAREPMRAATSSTTIAAATAPTATEPPAAGRFEIEINPPVTAPVPPAPKSADKLEVLSPELARASASRVATAPPTLQIPRPAPDPRPDPAPQAAPEIVTPPPPPRYAQAPEPQVRPSFDCRYARSPSERMVCSNEELAAADRRLHRAYERAIAAGVPARELRAEQDDWLSIRDDAARYSPDAVANVYEQRIGELNEIAEDPY